MLFFWQEKGDNLSALFADSLFFTLFLLAKHKIFMQKTPAEQSLEQPDVFAFTRLG